MPQTFYEVLCIFFLYAFLGWCTEVAYAALDLGKFVNRGFLNGPYCPIYGIGVLIVLVILTPLKRNVFLLYIGSVLLTSILEFLTGYVLERVFHNKWWDYSGYPFQIKGYVCLKFSVLWGFACSFIVLVFHPIALSFLRIIPKMLGICSLTALSFLCAVDCIFTVGNILKFNKRLRIMEEIAEKIREISDEIGENIYEKTTLAIEKKEAYEELSVRYRELAEKKIRGHDRLLKAFPGMRSKKYNDSLLKLKERLKHMAQNRKEG